MTNQELAALVQEIQLTGDMILQTIESTAPGIAAPAGLAQLLFDLASKAALAWTNAAGVDPTVENLRLLLPNPEPLSPPTQ